MSHKFPDNMSVLSLDDVRALKRLLHDFYSERQNPIIRSDPYIDHQAPEVYIALPPIAGIPALTRDKDPTGTGTGTHDHFTGTGTTQNDNDFDEGDKPGSADCDIYKIIGDGTLELVGISQTVYNLAVSTLSQQWITVVRDKFGKWIAVNSSSSTGGVNTIRFIVASSDSASLTVLGQYKAWDSGFKETDVPGDLNTEHGLSPPLGVVKICDPSGCYFNEPPDQLFGRVGYAKYMNSDTADSCRIGSAPPYPPQWEVIALCCPVATCFF